MPNSKPQSKFKRVLKKMGTAGAFLLGFVGFAFIEAAMSGSNLADPSQGFWWVVMMGVDVFLVMVLVFLIAKA